MAQPSTRTCKNCGAPLLPGQRFCSNCGAVNEEGTSNPTQASQQNYSPIPDMSTVVSATPPPPPPIDNQSYSQYGGGQYSQPYVQDMQQTPPAYQPAANQAPPSYATPQTASATPILRRIGCGVGIFLILLLALCGGLGYFVYNGIRTAANHAQATQQAGGYGATTGTGGSSATTPTAGPATTTPINQAITYAGVTITILDIKQAQSFSDDTNSANQSGVFRVEVKEQNSTTTQPDYLYSEILRLNLPNQQTVSPASEQQDISPDASTTRNNWIDFNAPTTTNVSQSTLIFGSSTQAQVQVPLTGRADLTQYQTKTATVNKTTQYVGLKWTIKTATRSLSSQGKQAAKGMYYVMLEMSIDNPSSNDYSAVWQDDLRLKAGDTTSSPDSANVPVTFAANSSGAAATALFLVPQTATSYTFVIIPDAGIQGSSQATIDFQI